MTHPADPTRPLTWVVGAGGLLGSSVVRAAARRGEVWTPTRRVVWERPDAGRVLGMLATDFAAAAGDRPWQVAWCAGAGVTGSAAGSLQREADAVDGLLAGIDRSLGDRAERGAFFLASSAGALYAGTRGAPFDEASVVRPISAYGEAKQRLETRAAGFSRESGVPVLVGRIANLYGPGQDLSKAQGLISQICRAQLLARPLTVYVSLDTLRDYLFAPDCAELVVDALDRLREERGHHMKVLASEQSVTIGQVVAEVRRLLKRRPWISFGVHPDAALQSRDLRLRSIVWPDLGRRRVLTPLPVGIRAIVTAQVAALQQARLA